MIQLYNTLSRKKEDLKSSGKAPLQEGRGSREQDKKLKLFVCGPTVYDFSHIGHARTYVAFDMIVKYLRDARFDVLYVQNITDLDDKIIQRAKEQNEDPKELAQRFEKEYMADMEALGISSVSEYARATDHISEIISQVERLLEKGYAYEIPNDGVYFDISKFKDYGKLSHRTLEQAQDAVSRIDESVGKRNKGDFALWKFSEPGEPMWDFKTGKYLGMAAPAYVKTSAGRPGWHIEDTAITEKYLGEQYDIHGGAQDLIFPHHEAEITQMESISGKSPLVNYWMHTGFLTVQGEKMSKSLGNFITIRDFLKNNSPRLLRFFILKTHYRSPIDYSDSVLQQSKNELERIDEFVDRLRNKYEVSSIKYQASPEFKRLKASFEKAMEDDVNTPLAISILFELIRNGNDLIDKGEMTNADKKAMLEFLKRIDVFFGFIFWGREKVDIPEEKQKLVQEREKYREQKNWAKADELRKQIEDRGWVVDDTGSGPIIKRRGGK